MATDQWIGVLGVIVGLVGSVMGIIVGLIGIGIAIYQIIQSEKIKDLYKKNSSRTYKDVSEMVITLTEDLISACTIVKKDCVRKQLPCIFLSTKINSAMSITRLLIRYCKDMDDDFKYKFNSEIDLALSKELDNINCNCLEFSDFKK